MKNRLLPTSFATCILILTVAGVFAQTPEINHEKYWIYRQRLLDDFMVSSSGNEPGTNIPASIRNKYNRQMRWGDATINLSNYMAVLATEYKLLKKNGLALDETVFELHNAMMAMERLDVSAAYFYKDPNPPPFPNGFFIRDDVPANFTLNWTWKNPSFADYPLVKSDYTDQDIFLNEMSQDQVWHLIVGLALISHLVDDSTRWHLPQYHGPLRLTLSQRAMIAGYRIVEAMQDKLCLAGSPQKGLCLNYWLLKNPTTGKAVKRGANPNFLKHGFAESGNFISQNAFGNIHWGNSHRAMVWYNLSSSFQLLQRFTGSGNLEYIYYLGSTATVGNVWSTRDLIRLFNRHQRLFFRPNPQYEHFALISCILHDDCPRMLRREKELYENLLNSAPIEGPLNFGDNPNHPYIFEWSSVNRFVWPERRGEGTKEHHMGEYNGLDYMLLYNLYHLISLFAD
ncbi:MAG TPA: hypothetical protein ENN08_02520 [Bacteroidales bacterium]|nr:hypothetical protein [Bacteroidales bacterium]